jgi:hypothetical protein
MSPCPVSVLCLLDEFSLSVGHQLKSIILFFLQYSVLKLGVLLLYGFNIHILTFPGVKYKNLYQLLT